MKCIFFCFFLKKFTLHYVYVDETPPFSSNPFIPHLLPYLGTVCVNTSLLLSTFYSLSLAVVDRSNAFSMARSNNTFYFSVKRQREH